MSGGGPAADPISRNAAFALATQLATAAFTAAVTIYLVRALGPEGYGIFALALGFSGLLLLPADFGVSQSAARFVAERRESRPAVAAVLFDAARAKLVITSLCAVALIALAGPIAALYDEPALAWPIRAVAVALFGQSLMLLFMNSFVALGRIATNFRLVLSESAVEATATVSLVIVAGGATAAAAGRAIGFLAGGLLGAVLILRLLGKPAVAQRAGGPSPSALLRYAGALLVIDGAFALFGQLDVLLVGALIGASAAGLYAAPAKLAVFLHYPGLAAANAVAPRLARNRDRAPDTGSFAIAIRYLILLQAALVAPIVVWADPITELVLGTGYDQSAAVLRALAPVIFMQGLGPLLSLGINYVGEARRRVPIALAAVALNAGLGVALIESIGIVGAAVAVDVSYFLYLSAHLWLCRRILGLRLRPFAVSLLRATAAAAALAGVLLLIGPGDLGPIEWLAGATLGGAAFLAVLLASRELTAGEIVTTTRKLLRGLGSAAT